MSYVNMVMYGAVLPSYSGMKDKKKKGKGKVIRMESKNNEEIKKFLDTCK